MNASIFVSALSLTRRLDALEIREVNSVVALRSILNIFACVQVSSPRLYRLTATLIFLQKFFIRSLFRKIENLCKITLGWISQRSQLMLTRRSLT